MESPGLLSIPSSITPSLSPLKNPSFLSTTNPNLYACLRCFSTSRRSRSNSSSPYWDSNAETIRADSFKFKFREESPENDDGDDDNDDADMGFRGRRKQRNWWSGNSSGNIDEGSDGILEEAIDSIWIFKVFRSFGWMLPLIIGSMLLATGPKAFLMALALPLGQSVLSLAIDKVWGRKRDSPKPRSRTKKKPFTWAASNVETSEEQRETSETSRERMGYQSWMVADDDTVEKKGSQRGSSFGGWDELDRRGGSGKGPMRRPSRTTDGPPKPQVGKKGKLSGRGRHRDAPLLLRLLIAVFPFLGSWTRIL